MTRPPSRLSNYPWVVVRLACKLCTRRGQYRLARLAARFGPEMDLERLLAHLASDCPYWRSNPRKYEVRCGARYIDLDHNLPPVDDLAMRQKKPARDDIAPSSAPKTMTMLSQWPGSQIVIICDICGKRDTYETAAIRAATPGKEAPLADLLTSLTAGCPHRLHRERFDLCGARLARD